jgi:basic membrane protein A
VAVVTAAALASSPGGKGSSAQTDTRSRPITLVLGGPPPQAQTAPEDIQDTIASDDLIGLRSAARAYGARVRVAYGNYDAGLARAAARSSVVLLGPGFDDLGELAAVTRAHPRTVYVLIGWSIHDAPFGRNVVGMTFDDHEVGYLGGYLSALMARRGHPSAVAGLPTPEVVKIVGGFEAGVRAAAPRMSAQDSYAGTFVDQSVCEHVANRQIDGGSTVVFDIAGTCGFGAIDAAGVRGVDAVGIDTDLASLGPQVIGSVVKRFDSAVELSVQLAVHHDLRGGRDTVLNLGNDGVDVVSLGVQVPAGVRTRLEGVITALRARDVAANHAGA